MGPTQVPPLNPSTPPNNDVPTVDVAATRAVAPTGQSCPFRNRRQDDSPGGRHHNPLLSGLQPFKLAEKPRTDSGHFPSLMVFGGQKEYSLNPDSFSSTRFGRKAIQEVNISKVDPW